MEHPPSGLNHYSGAFDVPKTEQQEITNPALSPYNQSSPTRATYEQPYNLSTVRHNVTKFSEPECVRRPIKYTTAYGLFFRRHHGKVKKENPQATFGEVSSKISTMWAGLTLKEKKLYKNQFKQTKVELQRRLW